LFIASCKGECDVFKSLFSSGADINLCECPENDASNNGDLPSWSYKMISAPELSKHLTTSHSPLHDAINNGEC
jgi:hypothetical protein